MICADGSNNTKKVKAAITPEPREQTKSSTRKNMLTEVLLSSVKPRSNAGRDKRNWT